MVVDRKASLRRRLQEPVAAAVRRIYLSEDTKLSYRAADSVLAAIMDLLCSCDGDPIECGHEAARGHAEEELKQAKAEIERLTHELGQHRLDERYDAMATAGAYDEEHPY
jgi:hypothetical protein